VANAASSLKLIRGTIDQVGSTVDVTWVQPRVLEGSQLDLLAGQFTGWTSMVKSTNERVNAQLADARLAVKAL
jgi:26S proteasome regulatory subunit N9